MTQAHHDRGHAQWSASSTARNWVCAGAIAMTTLAGEEKESEHAARGTAAHEIADRCLKNDKSAVEFHGTVVKTKQHEIEIDEEIVNGVQIYVDYVKSLSKNDGCQTLIEQNFSLAALAPRLMGLPAGLIIGVVGSIIGFSAAELLEQRGLT